MILLDFPAEQGCQIRATFDNKIVPFQITNRRRRASANKKSKNKMMGGMGGMGVGGDMPLTQEMLNELNKVSDIYNPLKYLQSIIIYICLNLFIFLLLS